ncbi:uncharacterized protein LOC105424760 [Pogonomyrmex barbatus]|uniref:Uncharacterized protein LOC105424760 n=1 Tax=Pogonomyrmex barbatus TaxID=144034 RepID=A0A6I9W4N9_9HYME|nr:uncharacterized protein LOC105424760 [Pogonomyrmex barbatus]
MSVNKFKKSLEKQRGIDDRSTIASLRAYVRRSALCLNPDDYDVNRHKIRHLDTPIDDTDATTKGYVDEALRVRSEESKVLTNELEDMNKRIRNILLQYYDIKTEVNILRHLEKKSEASLVDHDKRIEEMRDTVEQELEKRDESRERDLSEIRGVIETLGDTQEKRTRNLKESLRQIEERREALFVDFDKRIRETKQALDKRNNQRIKDLLMFQRELGRMKEKQDKVRTRDSSEIRKTVETISDAQEK